MASYLNRCEKTFRKYVSEYKIPHIRLGRDMLFNIEEVENYLLNLTMTDMYSSERKKPEKKKISHGKKNLPNQNKTQNKYAKLLGIS